MNKKQYNSLHYIRQGFQLISAPKVKPFVIIPLIINVIIAGLLIYALYHGFDVLIDKVDSSLPTWLQWLGSLLWIVYMAAIILFFVYVFNLLANLVAAPFNSFLAERVETHLTGQMPQIQHNMLVIVTKALWRQIQMITYFLLPSLVIFILFFIPVINIIAPVLWFLFSAWSLTMQYSDYAYDNHDISFHEMVIMLKNRRLLSLGYGSLVFILSLIPIVNLIVVPVGVAGATAMYVDAHHD